MLYAYELSHPTLDEPIRFVNDKADLLATLEADAPTDAGLEVEFVACPLSLERPKEDDGDESPTIRMGRPDVGGILKAALDAARDSLESWTLIERLYASDDTSGPALLPVLRFELTSAEISGAQASISASFDDDANVAVPRVTFKRSEYPGLMR
jgi:hypothetical protein